MIVVSDATALIILADLDRLHYLSNIFEKVWVPAAVYEELTHKEAVVLPQAFVLKEAQPDSDLQILSKMLDLGESEAIVLARKHSVPLIIDEKKGRKIALNMGVAILGLLGIVRLNIKKDFISKAEAEDFLKQARKNGYRISQKLIQQMWQSL